MNFDSLEFLMSDDSADIKKMFETNMCSSFLKYLNDSRDDEEILLNCAKFIIKSKQSRKLEENGHICDDPVAKRQRISSNTTEVDPISLEYIQKIYARKSETDFFDQFRMTKLTFWKLLNLIWKTEIFAENGMRGSLLDNPEIALEYFLIYASRRYTFRELAKKLATAESAIMKYITKCYMAVNSLEDKYLNWGDAEQITQVEKEFEKISGLNGVIGSLGSCYIEMRTVREPPAGYKVGKQRSIMYLLAVANNDMRFNYVNVGYPATLPIQQALESSSLGESLNDDDFFESKDKHLVSASLDFSLQEHLMVPFNPVNSDIQQDFNSRLVKCDSVKFALDYLRSRFGILQTQICANLEKIPQIVKACCIIHNICMEDESDSQYIQRYIYSEFVTYSHISNIDSIDRHFPEEASLKRDAIAEALDTWEIDDDV